MGKRRRTRWYDALRSDALVQSGAVPPGTITNEGLVTETELENELAGATLIRIVGSIICTRNAGQPITTAAVWMAPTYLGAVLPSDWTNDTFSRPGVMHTEIWLSASGADVQDRRMIDIRTQRKVEPGKQLLLSLQNHSIAGNDNRIAYHLRMLFLLS